MKASGFKELADALAQFNKSTERTVLRRVVTKALQPMLERAKQLAPVHEGHLRDSIVLGNNLNRNAKAQDKIEPRQGVRVFVGTAARNATPREFGGIVCLGDVTELATSEHRFQGVAFGVVGDGDADPAAVGTGKAAVR